MEQRFRERAERSGAGASAGGEIDNRVSDEMQQFFSESAQKLEQVVPQLGDSPGVGMKETTGEIRRKIDDFFAQVKEAGGGAVSVNTQELSKRKSKWSGFFPSEPGSPSAAPPRPKLVPQQSAVPYAGPQAAPHTPAQVRRAAPPAAYVPSSAAPAPTLPSPQRPASIAPRRESESGDGDRPKMDLKTALERLKRQNVVRDDGPPAAAAPAESFPAPAAAPRPVRPVAAPPGPMTAASPAAPTFAPRRDPTRTSLPSVRHDVAVDHARPPRRDPTYTGLPPVRKDGGPVLLPPRRDATRNFTPPPAQSNVGAPPPRNPTRSFSPPPPPSRETGGRTAAPGQSPSFTGSGLPPRREPSHPSPIPGQDDLRARLKPSHQAIDPPVARNTIPAGRGAAPLNRRIDAAPVDRQLPRREDDVPVVPPRRAESPIRVSQPLKLPQAGADAATSPAPGRAAELRASRPAEPEADAEAEAQVVEFDNIFSELEGLVRDTLKEQVDESFAVARGTERDLREVVKTPPAPQAPRPVRAAADVDEAEPRTATSTTPDPRGFARPADDEEADAPEAEVSPAAPYDWGVKKSSRPPGAWLIEGQEGGLQKPAAATAPAVQAAPSVQAPAAAPEAPAAPALGAGVAGGGVGGRGYLVKKLTEEVQKLAPAVAALQSKGVVSRADLGDAPSAPAAGKDDMVSVDQFADRKPVDLEKELSPARLVEELRRIRRLVDALLAKGLLTEADFTRAEED